LGKPRLPGRHDTSRCDRQICLNRCHEPIPVFARCRFRAAGRLRRRATRTQPSDHGRTPPSFDRSWDAALGAAADAGVQVTRADRANGRITGTKAGAAVTIDLRQQADNTLQVIFNAPDSKESNPTLNDRWLTAYNRRMGR
jgi:hypothetical protein